MRNNRNHITVHNNYDHSFIYNDKTVYASAFFEGNTKIARMYPAGYTLYLINAEHELVEDEFIKFEKGKTYIIFKDGKEYPIEENTVKIIGTYHNMYNDEGNNDAITLYIRERNAQLEMLYPDISAGERIRTCESEVVEEYLTKCKKNNNKKKALKQE